MRYEEVLHLSIDDYVRRYGTDVSSAAFLFFLFRNAEIEPDYEFSWGWLSVRDDGEAEYEPHRVDVWLLSPRWILAFVPDFLGRAALLRVERGEFVAAIAGWLETLPKPSSDARLVLENDDAEEEETYA